ncbi:hypothetical protein CKAH01_04441 [Colletotrichum kahawae]|uniref:Uncharacterized protein n=1 Tax=Colletotrichum kahawae TaxID=34407 RepID=A0AAE0D9G1_COLKA|nr:hypothetical protein CKAH01_04441 [Colletotrichum kahawae]
MRTNTLALLASLLLLGHRALAFDIYLNEDSDCPDEEISIICEEQVVSNCCNGAVNTLYSSARGKSPDSENSCGLQLAKDDTCATTDIPQRSTAGALGEEGGDEDPSTDEEPTDDDEDGEDDGGGDHGRRHAREVSPKKETWIQKNK